MPESGDLVLVGAMSVGGAEKDSVGEATLELVLGDPMTEGLSDEVVPIGSETEVRVSEFVEVGSELESSREVGATGVDAVELARLPGVEVPDGDPEVAGIVVAPGSDAELVAVGLAMIVDPDLRSTSR